MTATRDDRGRFVSAQEFAANELLKAAVREAIRIQRTRPRACVMKVGGGYEFVPDITAAAAVLRNAATAAELLLSERTS